MESLASKRFIIVGGKGGVGRTTVAAALALALVRAGKRVLLAQADAKDRLSRLLGGPPISSEIVEIGENLFAVNMSPKAALHEYGLMVLRYESVYQAVLQNRFAKYFLEAIPGLDEYALLGKAWHHTTETQGDGTFKYDIVILDGPATGHLLAMLHIPQAILGAVSEGPLTRDAQRIQTMLTDAKQTAMILVAVAEELPVRETIDLAARVGSQVGAPVTHLIVNQLWPDRFVSPGPEGECLAALERSDANSDPILGPLIARAVLARERRRLNLRYLTVLSEALPLPQIHLPLLLTPELGRAEVQTLSDLLTGRRDTTTREEK